MRTVLFLGVGVSALLKNAPEKQGNTYGSKTDACDACYSVVGKSCASYLGYQCYASNSAVLAQKKDSEKALGQTDFDDWYFSVNADMAGNSYTACCNAATQQTSYKSSICTTYSPNGDADAEDAAEPESEHHWSYCQKKLGGYPAVETPAK